MKPIHMMIRVLDKEKSIAFYRDFFNLNVTHELERETFTLVYMAHPDVNFELELTINKGEEKPYTHGEAYGHMAFSCPDLDEQHRRFTDAGLNPQEIKTFFVGEELFARFFFVQDPDGYKIEVLEQAGRFDY